MNLAPEKLLAIRGASVFVLAVLLLLSPVCGPFCQAQMCDTPRAGGEKSSCHESFNAAADSSFSHFSSIQNCALQQQPVALPVGFRSAPGDSPLVENAAHGTSPRAVRAADFHYDNHLYPRFPASAEWRSLSGFPEHSPLVLRI
jgi:hypothetical protein